jgi:DNA replication and repair protein RecF
MRLLTIILENFRNYKKTEVKVDSDLVLVLGGNASGKTNLLEAIYFLSHLKSFRSPDQFLVKAEEDFFTLKGITGRQKFEATVQINPSAKKLYKINDQKVKRNFWQAFKTVLFVPNDLNLFHLGPSPRRKFLDEILAQKDREYALALVTLDHILRQKSALLQALNQNQGDKTQLQLWNEQLAEASLTLCKLRASFLDYISDRFVKLNQQLTGFNQQFKIEYKTQIPLMGKSEILDRINQNQEAEIRSQMNLVGPHRDDFLVFKDENLNVHNSSRGELRTQILALKLLQAEYLSDEKSKPVILLDDVFSELDETRRKMLLGNLVGYQIFITTTEEHHLPKLAKDALVLKVENNDIIKA